ncbi:MAG: helix-hairpin-helix domain-containing protein, partial [Bacteroidales bacterium]|nr:helix-hairpin-helix domain-containing protein [Bacteroidales bacterium]
VTADEIQKLGFSEKQAESFVKWRSKGKKFYVAKDFASTFFVDANRYQQLEPYIKIDLEKLFGGKKMADLNTATAADLRALGLSADEAASIIDFREKVGYYFANWQIEDAIANRKRANELKANFYVCASVQIRKIDINAVSIDDLAKHPYFSIQQASAVAKLHETQPIKSIEDLKQIDLFSDKELKRIKNYLSF